MKYVLGGALALAALTTGCVSDDEFYGRDRYSASHRHGEQRSPRYETPRSEAQYRECIRVANNRYEGGKARSRVAGQSMAEAWCSCMWNESPESFDGNLVRFAESSRGQRINDACERYSGWQD